MSSTRSVRHGQVEIGIVEHNGDGFAAYGATVCGREITAYLRYKRGHYWLTTWAVEPCSTAGVKWLSGSGIVA